MTTLDVVQRLRAATDGRARPRASLCHRHIDDAPLVIVTYRMAGESAAPIGIMYGTRESDPGMLVAPEPRSRQIRFQEVFNPLAVELNSYVSSRAIDREISAKSVDLPTGPATHRAECRHRRVRRPAARPVPALSQDRRRLRRARRHCPRWSPPDLARPAGGAAGLIGSRWQPPNFCDATGSCGLSDLESEDLHVQLAWLDPPSGIDGRRGRRRDRDAASSDGTLAAAGPTPDPNWDRDVLDPLVADFNAQRERAEDHETVNELGRTIRAAVRGSLGANLGGDVAQYRSLASLPEAAIRCPALGGRPQRVHSPHRASRDRRRSIPRPRQREASRLHGQSAGGCPIDIGGERGARRPPGDGGGIGDGQAIAGTVVAVSIGPRSTLTVDRPVPGPGWHRALSGPSNGGSAR